jgi:ABC-type transporter Mla MlaB component
MLRITATEARDQPVTLRLEGQLIGPWVAELRRACQDVLRQGQTLTLDLADVSFLDADAIALVQALATRRVALRNCSPFVAEQLRVRA